MSAEGSALQPWVESPAPDTKNVGLRGVPVADTMVSDVDGQGGRLIYRGYDIRDLAERSTYEEVVYLLIYQVLPTASELATFGARLAEGRALSPALVNMIRALHPETPTMAALQSMVAALAAFDPFPGDAGVQAERERAVDLVAKTAGLVAAWHRIHRRLDPVGPSPHLSHAADFLRMVHDAEPDAELARELDIALILHADHSMNASTFTARAVASTRASLYASASAALGALSGDLHGGANARVMEMLQQVGSPDNAERFVREAFASGGRVMGMGHAVYRTDDPRAVILREMSRRAGEARGDPVWYRTTERIEKVTRQVFRETKQADIYPNVDMYSASLYHVIGLPTDLFTPVFAISRVAGWSAHVIEERFAEAADKPQLYRPASEYVGRYCGPESCAYEPPEARS
ncbi:MAG: citrate (Si)-synthase [Actinobacteria bacterium]|nr:citrate (Si)-synthase [Actinomycetota bacterium]